MSYLKNLFGKPSKTIESENVSDDTQSSMDEMDTTTIPMDQETTEKTQVVPGQRRVNQERKRFERKEAFLAESEGGIGIRTRELRAMNNLPAVAVYTAIGIPASGLSGIEGNHRKPGVKVASRLAVYYNVTLDFIFFGSLKGVTPRVARQIRLHASKSPEFRKHIDIKKS